MTSMSDPGDPVGPSRLAARPLPYHWPLHAAARGVPGPAPQRPPAGGARLQLASDSEADSESESDHRDERLGPGP